MYLNKTPKFIQRLFPGLIWKYDDTENTIYITFDDGPIPNSTTDILKVLRRYNAKATFFCVGDNIRKYPELYKEIVSEGHGVGNHTYNHLSGWSNKNECYLDNIEKGSKFVNSNLFRPPYGKMKPSQIKAVSDKYKIIMWDVLSGDFDPKIDAERCYKNVVENTEKGSIIVFHDNLKSTQKIQTVLPRVLDYFSNQGFKFGVIEN